MMFAQRRNRLTTHFSERIPVVKGRISVLAYRPLYTVSHPDHLQIVLHRITPWTPSNQLQMLVLSQQLFSCLDCCENFPCYALPLLEQAMKIKAFY